MSLFRILLDDAAADGGGSGGNDGGGKGKEGGASAETAQQILARHNNDSVRAIQGLMDENFKLREKNRKWKERAPAEDAVVLGRKDAAKWTEYQKLGQPDHLKQVVTEHGDFRGKITAYERKEELRTVAEAGKVNFAVLQKLAGDLSFEVTEKEEPDPRDKAKKVKVPVVLVKGADDETGTPLDEYAKQHWGEFLPALRPDANANGNANGAGPRGSARSSRDVADDQRRVVAVPGRGQTQKPYQSLVH